MTPAPPYYTTQEAYSSFSPDEPKSVAKEEASSMESWDFSVPIILATGKRGSQRFLRRRTDEDNLAASALQEGERPSMRAIRMANALMIERLLGTGRFKNASELASYIGVGKHLLSDLLALLNKPAAEIEKILFETY